VTCREVIEFLMEYLDGELPPWPRRHFQRHLAVCPACRAYLATYQATVCLQKEAFDHEGSEIGEPPEELIRAILCVGR
jgi:anti-sigma factor RsiW